MRKISLLLTASFLLSGIALAYTSADLEAANYLSGQGIINQQSTSAAYRLDATVTRAEVLKIAFNIAKKFPMQVEVPPNYTCTGTYFSDISRGHWACSFVEIAAKDGLITRTNTKFRPQDNITRAEALKLVMAASGEQPVSTETLNDLLTTYGNPFDRDSTDWQKKLIIRAEELGVVEFYGPFYPNRTATRAEVFGFAKKMLDLVAWNDQFSYEPGFSL